MGALRAAESQLTGLAMPRYLISFNDGDMQLPPEELPAVGAAAHAVVHAARDAGVLVFAGGLLDPRETRRVTADGAASGPDPGRLEFIAGLTLVDVPTLADAQAWAAKIAAACRCPQEVREFGAGSLP
jgi:hypothetical protein